MRVHTTGNVEEYAAAVEAFLKDDPCARNVLLTVMDLVRTAPATYPVAPSFWWITDSDAVVGAASWTPPHNLLVSSLPAEAVGHLAAAAIERALAEDTEVRRMARWNTVRGVSWDARFQETVTTVERFLPEQ